jgi:Mitochondrial carrier protein
VSALWKGIAFAWGREVGKWECFSY